MMNRMRNLRLKIQTMALSSKVPKQDLPYHKFMDQNYVAVTHSLSSYTCYKVQPCEPIKVK
jgi:hypothetical protein